MSKRLTPKLFANDIAFIDPLNSGSSVGYVIRRSRYKRLIGDVKLSSCDKIIQWDLDEGDALKKLDNAIAILRRARNAWGELESKLPKRRRKKARD